tara:strand:+ start:147 stop:1337 length:1191 start_codon:yes stop_codon:yes gene_type:complete
MPVNKILVKSGAAALRKLLSLGDRITPKAFRDEIVKLSPLNLDPTSPPGLRQAARRKKLGFSEDVKWHGSPSLDKLDNFRKGKYREDILGLHVGDANAALERGRVARGSRLLEKMGDEMDKGVRELEAKGIRADHLDILRAENLVKKLRLKNLERDIKATTPPISETTRSVNPFEDLQWDYAKRVRKTTVPGLQEQGGNWHMAPLHTKLGNQLRLPDVGMGASGGQWDSARDIVKAMRSSAYRGSGGISTDPAQYQGFAAGKALRKMGGLERKDRAILKKLLAEHEDDFARIDGAKILPKFNDKGERIRDRVVYYWGSNPLSDKKGMALLKRILKKAKINSIVYKNKFENRGQDSWILLDPRSQARSPVAEFLKRRGGATSGLLPLMDVLRGQREE